MTLHSIFEYYYLCSWSILILLYSVSVLVLLTWGNVRGKVALLTSSGISAAVSIAYIIQSVLSFSTVISSPSGYQFVQWYYVILAFFNIVSAIFFVVGIYQLGKHFRSNFSPTVSADGTIDPDDHDEFRQ